MCLPLFEWANTGVRPYVWLGEHMGRTQGFAIVGWANTRVRPYGKIAFEILGRTHGFAPTDPKTVIWGNWPDFQ